MWPLGGWGQDHQTSIYHYDHRGCFSSRPSPGDLGLVYYGKKKKTSGGLVKKDIIKNKRGRCVSKKRSMLLVSMVSMLFWKFSDVKTHDWNRFLYQNNSKVSALWPYGLDLEMSWSRHQGLQKRPSRQTTWTYGTRPSCASAKKWG